MPTLTPTDWLDILDDIRDQKAVLLIGPEMMQVNGKPLNQHIREQLHARNPDDIAFYYDRDGFFLFNSPESKVRVARQVKRLYRDITPDETILRRITEIPFHLVVSLNPDTFVTEAFYRHGIKHRFHYFQHRHRDNENEEIEKPSKALPLVYNLFGSKDQDDSLVLDYDDVYKMLQSALGTSSLPNKLMRSFREAGTYIFLGFQFDKWYSQLLLKFLSDNGRSEKMISIDKSLNDIQTNDFVMQQFRIRFMGDQFDFFTELYQRCSDEKMLRNTTNSAACPEAVDILKRVAMGEIDNALDLLRQAASGKPWENDAIQLQARYALLEREKDKTDSRDYRTGLAQIIDAILEMSKNACP
ncbi:MAG: SIR2 family protein [Saprospiraceae bacterium]|nr:SIR2 family protein [Saprospiraceae bacterium]